MRRFLAATLIAATAFGPLVSAYAAPAAPQGTHAGISQTTTPITHLVIIFQENVSFDHYFGTYPNALNPSWGEVPWCRNLGSIPRRARRPSTASPPRS